jgi:hypothetical protein
MDRLPSSDLVADYKRFQLAEVDTACISSSMKVLALRCLVALTLLAAATFAFANPFKSKIISDGDSVLEIIVPGDHFMKITNFTQDGGTDRAVVEVTLQGDTDNGGTTNVLTATRIDFSTGSNAVNFPEIGNRVTIAGPARVRIRPVVGAKLFITYKKERDEGSGGGGGGNPTPIPIVNPTPTSSPTCSVGPPFFTPCPSP